MKQAIKLLQKRYEDLNKELARVSETEPESIGAYEFQQNDILNLDREMMELEKAVEILNNHQSTKQ